MLAPGAFRQSTASRLRDRGESRYTREDCGTEGRGRCVACDEVVAVRDLIVVADGSICLVCDADDQTRRALQHEMTELQYGLGAVVASLGLVGLTVVSLAWILFSGAWHWTFVAWVAAQWLMLWLGLYGARQGYDAVRTIDGMEDDVAEGVVGLGRVRLLGQLAFFAGVVGTGGSVMSLTLTGLGFVMLSALH